MAQLKTVDDLNKIYEEAETADRETFAEFRSNVQLIAGEHYSKRTNYFQTLRDNREKTNDNKLRLTMNHMYRVVKHYVANILGYAPGTAIYPQRDSEIQDQKAAELNNSVWLSIKDEYRMKEIKREDCFDFCGVGEVCRKIFWDPNQGKLLGYAPLTDELTGEPAMDPMTGEQLPDEEAPQFEGRFVFERVFAFNLFRAPQAHSMKDSPYMGIRKMVDTADMKKRYADDAEKLKMFEESRGEDFVVFDSKRNTYQKTKNQTLLKEIYYRPCHDYPMGYFYFWTTGGIIEHGELPEGLFPLVWAGFDEYPTDPRAKSVIKIARPYQGELNRAGSAQAMHQITIGDDKIIYQAGTKLAQGSLLPGIRGLTYQGAAPEVLPGRDGAQYQDYYAAKEAELYRAVSLEEINEDSPKDFDATALLFQAASQKKKFNVYIEKFEQYLIDFTTLTLALAKYHLPDSCVIPAIGKAELVNLEEFRSSKPLNYLIKVEARDETLETKLGTFAMIQHITQYSGNNLEREDIGKLCRAAPYGNFEEIFDDFTIDYDNVKNDILALERGQMPTIGQYDNHDYYIAKLTHRIKQQDFRFLAPEIQQNFQILLSQHEEASQAEAQALIDAKNEYIPTGGAMIAADMYIPSQDPEKSAKRVRVPYQAMDWLLQQLDAQGTGLDKLEAMNPGAVQEINGGNNGNSGAAQSPQPADQSQILSPQDFGSFQ